MFDNTVLLDIDFGKSSRMALRIVDATCKYLTDPRSGESFICFFLMFSLCLINSVNIYPVMFQQGLLCFLPKLKD